MAAPTTWTLQIDNLFTTTWAYRKPGAVEQAFRTTPLAFYLMDKGRIKKVKGFRRIEINLDYGTNSAVTWLEKGDELTEVDNEFLTVAYEDWKYAAVNIVRYYQDDQKNKGQAQLINYVESKLASAERAMWQELETVLFSDGSVSKKPLGLQKVIADTIPSSGTDYLHGIDRVANTWWRQNIKSASGVFGTYGIPDMRNLLNTLSSYRGVNPRSYVLVTDQAVFEAYEDELLEHYRIVDKKMADLGFENYTFKGRTLLWSPQAPSGKVYFINTDNLEVWVDEDEFLEMTEWKPIPNRLDRMAQLKVVMNMACSRLAVQGVLTGITF